MKGVLCFLKELDFADKLDKDCLEKLVRVNKIMVREIEEYNISKLIYAINIIDEIKLSDVTNDLDQRLERTYSFRSVIFHLIGFKHLVETNDMQDDKQ